MPPRDKYQAMQDILAQGGDQKAQMLEALLKPRGRIAQAAGNRPRYDVMSDPNYKPGANPQYGRVGMDVKVQNNSAISGKQFAEGQTTAPRQGGGFMSMLAGLLGGKSPQQAKGPRINPQTGLPFGTMPGDPAYLDQQVKNAPRATVAPDSMQTPVGSTMDPAIQNLLGIAQDMRGLQQANPGWTGQPAPQAQQPMMVGGSPVPQYGNVPKGGYAQAAPKDKWLPANPAFQASTPPAAGPSPLNVKFGEMPFSAQTSPAEKYRRLLEQGYTSQQAASLAGLKSQKTQGTFEGTGLGGLLDLINQY